MKSRTIGWLILLAALAVPALFFQNFLKKMQTSATPYEVKRKPEGGAFGNVRSQPGGGLPNPIQSSSSPATAASGTPPATTSPGGFQPAPNEPQPAPPQDPAPASPDAAAPEAPLTAQASDGRERIEYAPQSERDPTLSVIDEQKLALEREAQRRTDEDMRSRVSESKKKKVVRVKTSEEQIQVQGIVGTQAIVNDEVRQVGDKVLGCTIARVTSKGVFIRCGGKSIYKTVQ